MRQFYCSRLFGFKIKPFLFKEKQKEVTSSGVRSTFTPRLLFFYTTGFAVMRSVSSKCISAVQEATPNQAWLTALGSDCRADDVLFVPLRTGKSFCFFSSSSLLLFSPLRENKVRVFGVFLFFFCADSGGQSWSYTDFDLKGRLSDLVSLTFGGSHG